MPLRVNCVIISTASLQLDICHLLTTLHLAFSIIYPLFVDRFRHSLRFCQREFDKEAITDFRELSFYGCYIYRYIYIDLLPLFNHYYKFASDQYKRGNQQKDCPTNNFFQIKILVQYFSFLVYTTSVLKQDSCSIICMERVGFV